MTFTRHELCTTVTNSEYIRQLLLVNYIYDTYSSSELHDSYNIRQLLTV